MGHAVNRAPLSRMRSLRTQRVHHLARTENIEEIWFDKVVELVETLTLDHIAHIEARPQLTRARALAQRALAQLVNEHRLTDLNDEVEAALLAASAQYFRYWIHNAQIVRHGFGSIRDATKLMTSLNAARIVLANPAYLNRLQVSEREGDENYLVLVGKLDAMLEEMTRRAERAAFKAHKIKVTGSGDILMPAQILFQFYLEHVDAEAKFWTYGSSNGSASEDLALCASPAFDFVLSALHLIDDSIERNALKELAKQLYRASAPSPERAFSLIG